MPGYGRPEPFKCVLSRASVPTIEMPFPRKKIKIVDDGGSGRERTKWVCPRKAVSSISHHSELGKENTDSDHHQDRPGQLGLGTLPEEEFQNVDSYGSDIENREPQNRRKTYKEIKIKDVANWELIRNDFQRVAVEKEGPPSSLKNCLSCGIDLLPHSKQIDGAEMLNLFRCKDCGPYYFVCGKCLVDDHYLRPSHWPQRWNGTSYVNFPLHDYGNPMEIPMAIHSCESRYKRCIKIVDIQGRVQDAVVTFCHCEKEALTLFKLGFWPSSSLKPTTAYSTELLKTLRSLMLECHVSVLGMANSMRWRNGLTKAQENGQIVLMLDGTFGCVRKQSSGCSTEPPKHGERFFVDESSVDEFVDQHCQSSKDIRMDCSNFRAGADNMRSKMQYRKLDVTGIFGCSCKHDIPGCFVNMKHGERLGYPVYIIQAFLAKFKHSNVSFGILYDISCLLVKHIKKNKLEDKFQNCTFATPDWHAYGHVASCQVQFAVRFLADFGITDGEGVERLWSYLRQFTAITKEMTPSHRIDLLTDGLIHFAQRKNASMEFTLAERYQKADRILSSSTEELSQLKKDAKDSFNDEDILQWHETEKIALARRQSGKRKDQEWAECYIEKLLDLSAATNQLQSCTTIDQIKQVRQHMKEIEKELKKIERDNRIPRRWLPEAREYQHALSIFEDQKKTNLLVSARSQATERIFHLNLKKKYSAGQDIPKRIETMIKKASKKLNETVEKYNSNMFSTTSNIPNTVTFQDLKDPEGFIYESVNIDFQLACSLPPSIRRKATALYFLKQRAHQEKRILSEEAKRLLGYWKTELEELSKGSTNCQQGSSLLILNLVLLVFCQIVHATSRPEQLRRKKLCQDT
eukprot:Seg151.1 transcript_id=Seg151.1/GoldUCD/mRNA.D3Y31 product="hypothetical protein" protein_id=Seg151.1/GoldUCD/D3Y31